MYFEIFVINLNVEGMRFFSVNKYFDHLYKNAGFVFWQDTQKFFPGKNQCADRVPHPPD